MVQQLIKKIIARNLQKTAQPVSGPTQQFTPISNPQQPVVQTPEQIKDFFADEESEQFAQNVNQQHEQFYGKGIEEGQQISSWVYQNFNTQQPIPNNWLSDPEKVQSILTLVESYEREFKSPPSNPSLQRLLSQSNVVNDDATALQREMMGHAKKMIETFTVLHEPFLDKLSQRVYYATKDQETAGRFKDLFLTEYLGPRSDPSKRDNRLALLTMPETQKELMGVPAFNQRVNNLLNEYGLTTDDLLSYKGDAKAINAFSELLQESAPGKRDSILDAMQSLFSSPNLPPGLGRFYAGVAKNFGTNATYQKWNERKKEVDLLNRQVGEDDKAEVGGQVSEDQGKISDKGSYNEIEMNDFFNVLKNVVSNKITGIRQMSNHILEDFYKYYNDKGKPAYMSVPGVKDGVLSVADVFQSIMAAATDNVEKIIQPGNYDKKKEAYDQIAKNQQSDDFNVKFKSKKGKIGLRQGKNLSDMGVSLKGLVKSYALIPYFYQIGSIKEAIHDMRSQGITDPEQISQRLQQQWPQIQQRIAADYQNNPGAFSVDPNLPLKTDISPEFVKNTLRELRQTSSILKSSVQPNNKVAIKAMDAMNWNWTKMYPFIFNTVKDYPSEVRNLWRDVVGIHKRMKEPVSEDDINRIENAPPEVWKGKQWYEHSLDEITEAAWPGFEFLTPEQQATTKIDTPEKYLAAKNTWKKRFDGMTSANNIRSIYERFFDNEIPPHIDKYLRWRDIAKKERKMRAMILQRRILQAYARYENHIESLKSIKNSLTKFASTGRIDSLISRITLEGFEELQRLSSLI